MEAIEGLYATVPPRFQDFDRHVSQVAGQLQLCYRKQRGSARNLDPLPHDVDGAALLVTIVVAEEVNIEIPCFDLRIDPFVFFVIHTSVMLCTSTWNGCGIHACHALRRTAIGLSPNPRVAARSTSSTRSSMVRNYRE